MDFFFVSDHNVGPRIQEFGHVNLVTRSHDPDGLWRHGADQIQHGKCVVPGRQGDHNKAQVIEMKMFEDFAARRITQLSAKPARRQSRHSGRNAAATAAGTSAMNAQEG